MRETKLSDIKNFDALIADIYVPLKTAKEIFVYLKKWADKERLECGFELVYMPDQGTYGFLISPIDHTSSTRARAFIDGFMSGMEWSYTLIGNQLKQEW